MIMNCDNNFLKKENVSPLNITKKNFTDKFVFNDRRYYLWNRLIEWDNLFSGHGFGKFTQWIGGSFVSEKENPSDIDVMTIYLRPSSLANGKDMESFKEKNPILFDRRSIMSNYNIDNVMLDGGYPLIIQAMELCYWVCFLGHDKNRHIRPIYQIIDIGISK